MAGRWKSPHPPHSSRGASAALVAKNAAHPPQNTVRRKRGTGFPTAAQNRLSKQVLSEASAALPFFLLPKLQN
jgi:hypothetical protein